MSGYSNKQVARAFGVTLRAARHKKGLSQDKLSELCDFDRTYPSMLERGLRSPTLATVFRIANALEVEPTVVVGDTHAHLLRV
jgi:transcriptional regulator with XRE-family HTH domain